MTEAQVVSSAVTRVTLFEDRAEVVRRATVQLAAGASALAIDGVSAAVDDPSVIVRAEDRRVRVLGTRVGRQIVRREAASGAEILAIEADQSRARDVRRKASHAVSRTSAEHARVAALLDAWTVALGRVPRSDEAGGEDWRSAATELDAALTRALDALSAAREREEAAEADVTRAEVRLELARRLEPRQETRLLIEVEADEAIELSFEVVYRVPCGLWRPEHRATLEGAELVITTYATVWQCTGEAWTDVPLVFSTARPARNANPPLLSDDVLELRKKTQEERRVVIVEAREQSIQRTGTSGDRSVEEMPGVDDGGEPLSFSALRPATVASDGAPCRVEIQTVRLPVTVDRVAMPELGPVAHLRARAVNRGPAPILAGPLTLARERALVGRGRMSFVAVGEPFELGFGADDGLRVRRARTEKRETTAITSTQRVTRTVTVYLSNTSGEGRTLTVMERYPVSELGDVSIEVLKSVGAKLDARDGIASFEVEVEARGTRELELVYRVEAASKVTLRI